MDLEQTSDPGHTMKYKEKIPRDFQERPSLRQTLDVIGWIWGSGLPLARARQSQNTKSAGWNTW